METIQKEIMESLSEEFRPIMEKSPDGVYLWLDEKHMICNEKLTKMFGYSDIKDMQSKHPFLENFVSEDDRESFSDNYHNSVAGLKSPVRFNFHGIRRDKSKFCAETDMIPISYKGKAVAYHFVRESDKCSTM